jgi:hypothetical protein
MSAPVAVNISTSTIANIARNIAKKVGYEPGGDLREVVRKLGGTITHENLWGGASTDSGSIEIKDGRFEIRLAMATGPLRDRFTIAHELGHYVLHYLYRKQILKDPITDLVAQRYGTSDVEREANQFAAAFLMPQADYEAAYHAAEGDHTILSRRFGVSRIASEVRAQALGLPKYG